MKKTGKAEKKVVMSFRIDPRFKTDLKKVAKIERITIGILINRACHEYVERKRESFLCAGKK